MARTASSTKRHTKKAAVRRVEDSVKKAPRIKRAKPRKSLVKKTTPYEPAQIVVKYDVGFNNTLSIRGNGAGLSWDRGALSRISGQMSGFGK